MSVQKKVAVVETQYFPSIVFFYNIINCDALQIEAYENYQKGSYRNRCHIVTAQGIQVLSVPLKKGKNAKMPIREVEIAYDFDWQKQHRESIKTAYGSAPFWEHYAPVVLSFFDKKPQFLFDLNFDILKTILKLLKLDPIVDLKLTDSFIEDNQKNEKGDVDLIFLKNKILPKSNTEGVVRYPQIFEDRLGFVPDLSILDLIFCAGGAQAREKLKNVANRI